MKNKYVWNNQLITYLSSQLNETDEQVVSDLNSFAQFVALPENKQLWVPLVAKYVIKGKNGLNKNEEYGENIKRVIYISKAISNLKRKYFKETEHETDKKFLADWFGHEKPREEIKENPMRGSRTHGGYSEYPLYSILILHHPDKDLSEHFHKIQFQLAYLSYKYIQKKENTMHFHERLVQIGRILRRISAKDAGAHARDSIASLKPENFHSGIREECLRDGYTLSDSNYTKDIIKFVCFLSDTVQYQHRNEKNSRRKRKFYDHSYAYYPGNYLPEQEEDIDVEKENIFDEFVIIDDKDISPESNKNNDLPGDTHHPGGRVRVSKRNNGPSGRLFSKHQSNHLAMDNQCLGLGERSYSSSEMALIMRVVTDMMKLAMEDDGKDLHNISQLQCAVLLMLQVWLGLSYQQAKTAYIANEQNISDIGAVKLFKDKKKFYWIKSIPKPKVKSYEQFHPEISREMDQYLQIEDVFNISHYFLKLSEIVDGDNYIYPMEKLDQKGRIYKEFLKKVEQNIRNQFRVIILLTDSKLNKFLAESIIETHGDPVDALYLTGKPLTPCGTQIFYYMPKISHLEKVYRTTVTKKLNEIYDEGLSDKREFKTKVSTNHKSIGLGNCPTVESLKHVFHELRKIITDKNEPFIKRHNVYVAYVTLVIGYLTGIRAIVNPCPRRSWSNNSEEFVVISDKDGLAGKDKINSFYNTRIIPKTKVLKAQLKYWDLYQSYFIEGCKKQGIKPVSTFDPQKRTLLLLNEDGKNYDVASPKRIENILKPFYRLKLNSNRRFLRTELSERNANYEMIDTFMSHSSIGQESWHKFSTSLPREYHSVIKVELEMICDDIEIFAIASPFKKIPSMEGL